MLLQTGLDVHARKAPEALQPFHAHMEQRFAQMKQFVEKEYGIKVEGPNNFLEIVIFYKYIYSGVWISLSLIFADNISL